MESNVLSSVASSSRVKHGQIVSALIDASDEFRYLVMRTMRFVIALFLEIVTLVSTVVAGISGLFAIFYVLMGGWTANGGGYGIPNPHATFQTKLFTTYPVWTVCVSAAVAAFFWMQWLAVAMPHHWETTMPGLRTKKCWKCSTEIPDQLTCVSCGAFRLGRVLTAGLWLGSLGITAVSFVHDMICIALGFATHATKES